MDDEWFDAPAYAPSFGEYRRIVCEECGWESAARTGLTGAWRVTRHYNDAHPGEYPASRTACPGEIPETRVEANPFGDQWGTYP